MNQIAIDFYPCALARKTDPSTSHQAAARVGEFRQTHFQMIIDALASGSKTKDEIAAATSLDAYQVARRLPEMQKAGLAAPTGETRSSKAGRQERVWGIGNGKDSLA